MSVCEAGGSGEEELKRYSSPFPEKPKQKKKLRSKNKLLCYVSDCDGWIQNLLFYTKVHVEK